MHAESCTSKWFNLKANFTQCESADQSRLFNRLEYERQQLADTIGQMREKRPLMTANSNDRAERVVFMSERSGWACGSQLTRKAIEPAENAAGQHDGRKGAIPKVKRPRVKEANADENDRLAQQIADWPHNQPEPDSTQPPMQFDASVIANFLQHAARFALRRNLKADETNVAELLEVPVTWMHGRHNDPPSKVELAVRTAQKWQSCQEMEAMWHNAPQMYYDSNAPNPGNYQIHVSFEGRRRSGALAAETSSVRTVLPQKETATIEEVEERPIVATNFEWVLRFSHPDADTIALGDAEGDINAVTEAPRELSNGLSIRRDGGMVEIRGPPTANVAVSMEYRDKTFRLRLCSSYVIIDERFRLDNTGVSEIIKNEEALSAIPEWEMGFLGAQFNPIRMRFADQRARVLIQNDDLVLVAA